MLSIRADDCSNLQLQAAATGFERHTGANAEVQSACDAIAHRDLIGVDIGPPYALRDLVAFRRSVCPAQFGALEHAARKVLSTQFVQRLPIQ